MNDRMKEKSRHAWASFTFLDDLEKELASRTPLLERGRHRPGTWRPHEKSKTFGELARHLADIPGLAATEVYRPFADAPIRG